jgi:hypothetical protein
MPAGRLKKMKTALENVVHYSLVLSESVDMNTLIGQPIELQYSGVITCTSCGKRTNKSFGEGFCYPCFRDAPEAAECIIRPELCRAHLGEGRDPEWEARHHNQPHVVYLALTDAVKVGITRADQVPTRWIDQGAYQAIPLARTANRYEAGVLEVALKSFFTDKTNWRKMLRNENDTTVDLVEEKWRIEELLPGDLRDFITDEEDITKIHYPVLTYPNKLNSINLDSEMHFAGKLLGIKGQYLLLDNDRVINLRKYTGYEVELKY